jgi:hypothetical protein
VSRPIDILIVSIFFSLTALVLTDLAHLDAHRAVTAGFIAGMGTVYVTKWFRALYADQRKKQL